MRTILSGLLITLSLVGFSQGASEKKGSVETFLNISNALVRATGNSSTSLVLDEPYLIGFKYVRHNNSAFRLGTNFSVTSNRDFTSDFFTRTTADKQYSVNIGWEFRRKLAKKFNYYYGFDGRFTSNISTVEVQTVDGTELIYAQERGPGISPFLGFSWNINDRISLFTESHLAVDVLGNYRYVRGSNGLKTELENSLSYLIRPIPPGAVFIAITL
jgi:hypothetical protein